jgi:hypothetical protein
VGRLKRFAGFVWRWITVVIPVFVVVLTAASGVTNGHYHVGHHRVSVAWTLIVVAALLALVEAVIVARRQLRVGNLEAANAELEGRAIAGEEAVGLMRAELIALQERARQFSSERVSLLRCDGDHFTLVARRSPCPPFDQSLGRGTYPLDEGILGEAWANGTAGVSALPPSGPAHEPPRRRWLDAQRRFNIPEQVATNFTMRSQAYAAFRLAERDRALGVIVFESTVSVDEAAAAGPSPTKRTVAELEPLVKEAGDRLAGFLRACASISAPRLRELLDAEQGPTSRQQR